MKNSLYDGSHELDNDSTQNKFITEMIKIPSKTSEELELNLMLPECLVMLLYAYTSPPEITVEDFIDDLG